MLIGWIQWSLTDVKEQDDIVIFLVFSAQVMFLRVNKAVPLSILPLPTLEVPVFVSKVLSESYRIYCVILTSRIAVEDFKYITGKEVIGFNCFVKETTPK